MFFQRLYRCSKGPLDRSKIRRQEESFLDPGTLMDALEQIGPWVRPITTAYRTRLYITQSRRNQRYAEMMTGPHYPGLMNFLRVLSITRWALMNVSP